MTYRERRNLRESLRQEALANAERDLEMAAEWFPIDEETWQRDTNLVEVHSTANPAKDPAS